MLNNKTNFILSNVSYKIMSIYVFIFIKNMIRPEKYNRISHLGPNLTLTFNWLVIVILLFEQSINLFPILWIGRIIIFIYNPQFSNPPKHG